MSECARPTQHPTTHHGHDCRVLKQLHEAPACFRRNINSTFWHTLRMFTRLVRTDSAIDARRAHLSAEEECIYASALQKLDHNTWMLILEVPAAIRTLVSLAKKLRPERRDVVLNAAGSASEKTSFLDLAPAAQQLLAIDRDRWLLDTVVAGLNPVDDLQAIRDSRSAGRDVRNRFVLAHLGLAVSIARRIPERQTEPTDIVHEAVLGLIRAVHRFDPKLGFRFATYAHRVIDGTVRRGLLRSRLLAVPEDLVYAQARASRARDRLTTLLCREPTAAEIAHKLGISPKEVRASLDRICLAPISCDAPMRPDGSRCWLDVMADNDMPMQDEVAHLRALARTVIPLLRGLAPLERDVVIRRFGLLNQDEATLQEIGTEYHLSRERIRQIQASALAKLRRRCGVNTVEA